MSGTARTSALWRGHTRTAACAVSVAVLLASACGSSSGSDAGARADSSASEPTSEAAPSAAVTTVAATEAEQPSDTTGSGSATQTEAAPAASDDVPAVEMINIATGEPVNLRALFPADTPQLFWFWAPH